MSVCLFLILTSYKQLLHYISCTVENVSSAARKRESVRTRTYPRTLSTAFCASAARIFERKSPLSSEREIRGSIAFQVPTFCRIFSVNKIQLPITALLTAHFPTLSNTWSLSTKTTGFFFERGLISFFEKP